MNTTSRIRTPRRRSRVALASVASLALIAAACGGDDSATTTVPDTQAPATQPAATDAPDMSGGPFGPACTAVPADGPGSFDGMAQDPAGTAASNNPLLSTLVKAVVEAELVDTLNSEGPFTIFAPTNDAFAAIPADQLNAILADRDLLTSILTYHVVAGERYDAAGLGQVGTLTTVNGETLTFSADGTMVNGASVVCSDVMTANATVHIIDAVLLPPMDDSADEPMMETSGPTGPACVAVPADGPGSFDGMAQDPAGTAASNNPVLSTLVSAVVAAGLVDTLNSEGPFTIFAPSNDAFAAIPEDDLNAVLADVELLTSILTYHVVAGERLSAAELVALGSIETVQGGTLTFTDVDGALTVNGEVTSICQDISTANATVHIIDTVLMPG